MLKKNLNKIPSLDSILSLPQINELKHKYDPEIIKNVIRFALQEARANVKTSGTLKNIDELANEVIQKLNSFSSPYLKQIINASGVILHTNLGRAPLGDSLVDEIIPIIKSYSNLEFDLKEGKRGTRTGHVSELLKIITGAEDALVVNNNAAAIVLILHTLCNKKEVIISRGELIEIGGSFRIPEIMKASGAKMIEVGTTNRTTLSDYSKAINKNTKIIFKAHKSNYYIKGFTNDVEVGDLAKLSQKNNLIFVYDVGSGLLKRLNQIKHINEPNVFDAIRKGSDLVTFSGDKLLGGTQAGIIAGKKNLIEKLNKAPMMRALRVDKITIALLSSLLKLYLSEKDLMKNLPLYQMLGQNKEILFAKAEKLKLGFELQKINSEIVESNAQCGGGSLPELVINSFAVKLKLENANKKLIDTLFQKLLNSETPVLSILREGNIYFDLLTIKEEEIDLIPKLTCKLLAQLLAEK
jgi:L-seryl-tRNA(Ser) seleniumtransferase